MPHFSKIKIDNSEYLLSNWPYETVIILPLSKKFDDSIVSTLNKLVNDLNDIKLSLEVKESIGMWYQAREHCDRKSMIREYNKVINNKYLSDDFKKEFIKVSSGKEPEVFRVADSFYLYDNIKKRNRIKKKKIKRHGYIYFVGGNNFVKIGKTKKISNRMKFFEIKLPFEIELIHIVKSNDYDVCERIFHRRFKEKRINGEWFNLSENDIDKIKGIDVMNFDDVGNLKE